MRGTLIFISLLMLGCSDQEIKHEREPCRDVWVSKTCAQIAEQSDHLICQQFNFAGSEIHLNGKLVSQAEAYEQIQQDSMTIPRPGISMIGELEDRDDFLDFVRFVEVAYECTPSQSPEP